MLQENVNLNVAGAPPALPQGVELKPVEQSEGGPPPAAAGNAFLSRGNLMVLGIYLAGFAGLYTLSLRSGPSRALAQNSTVHAKVESALDLLEAAAAGGAAEPRSTAKAIVGEFYMAAKQRQVSSVALKGNPFLFHSHAAETKPVEQPKVRPETLAAADEEKQAMATLRTLRLQSVLVGRQTMAVISNNLLTSGQKIGPWTVGRISTREVELTWRDKTYVLKMP